MTEYDYYNLPAPEEMGYKNPLPEEMFSAALAAVVEAVDAGEVKVAEVRAAYAYKRKYELFLDNMGSPRNPSYSSDDDDIVLQFAVRVRNPKNRPELAKLAELEHDVTEAAEKAERERLEAEIAAAETAAAEAEAEAAKKRKALEDLRNKKK